MSLSFKEISRVFQESSEDVQVRLKGISSSFKGVSRVFKRSSTGVSEKFQWCKGVLRQFQESFMVISRKFQGISKGASREFLVGLNGIRKKYKGNFRVVLNVFQGCF